jgi:hypothetical protein
VGQGEIAAQSGFVSLRIARILLVTAALLGATASALVFFPIAALIDPVTRGAAADLAAAASFALLERALNDPAAGDMLSTMLSVIRSVAAAICLLPILIVGLVGEAAKVGSWIWYSVATGAVAAAVPFIVRGKADGSVSPAAQNVEMRFAAILFLTGVVCGLIYWLVAGRTARQVTRSPGSRSGCGATGGNERAGEMMRLNRWR